MLGLFEKLKSFVKLKTINEDNRVFKLHYRVTAAVLILFSIVLSARQYVGEPILCISDINPEKQKVIDTFCWVNSTFTVGRTDEVSGKKDNVKYHAYYQWVCFILFFQAVAFYLPRYIWKMSQGNLLRSLSENMKSSIVDRDLQDKRLKQILKYFNQDLFRWYTVKFIICEMLNLFNVVVQFAILNRFLGGASNVLDLVSLDRKKRIGNPVAMLFPIETRCTFNMYGAGGSVQPIDALCILPLNEMNEMIAIFLWFWLLLLAGITTAYMIYRFLTVFVKPVRYYAMRWTTWSCHSCDIRRVSEQLDFGDWFFVQQLYANVNKSFGNELMSHLVQIIGSKKDRPSSTATLLEDHEMMEYSPSSTLEWEKEK